LLRGLNTDRNSAVSIENTQSRTSKSIPQKKIKTKVKIIAGFATVSLRKPTIFDSPAKKSKKRKQVKEVTQRLYYDALLGQYKRQKANEIKRIELERSRENSVDDSHSVEKYDNRRRRSRSKKKKKQS